MKSNTPPSRKLLAQKHSFLRELIFASKIKYFTFKRSLNNGGVKTYSFDNKYANSQTLGQSVSELWNKNDNHENWIMTAGKIQNLRIAASRINGTTIPAGQVFSFWKYIGKPSKSNGFVVGREIREGCIVPSIAGGLCQLSNALYDAALKAGFTINERHRHTQVVKGSLAEKGKDATVKWNYVDLRFSSANDFTIVIEMDDKNLTVTLKGIKKILNFQNISLVNEIAPSPLNDCLSCRNTDCYICATNTTTFDEQTVTYVLDQRWVEYENYINTRIRKPDFVLQAFSPFWAKNLKQQNNTWNIKGGKYLYYNRLAIKRIVNYHRNKPKNIFSWQLRVDEELTKELIKKIPVESTHLVVSQNLLPFLQKYYAFAGRTYEVLMTSSAVDTIQSELDIAQKKYPDSPTLSDFRVSNEFIELENKSLKNANKLITPHLKISRAYSNTTLLNWQLPHIGKSNKNKKIKILFPGSALARKGAYELRQLMQDIGLDVTVRGKAIEYPNFFDGLDVHFSSVEPIGDFSLIIYPAYVEHQPRTILRAIALGIPVVISDACGIAPNKNVYVFQSGDYYSMKALVVEVLKNIP